ncbi:MAG TPA: hypothetical protein PKD64_06830 [Pirellulaceae bacterium]|nr:hypothetical protein [Pirellulaceae bacterium]HMP68697.1 hypothetical protein [Pirellulaceae bacterium]
MNFEFAILGSELQLIHAIEVSVLWHTEGKGNEDVGIHYFNRLGKRDLVHRNLQEKFRYATFLPPSPLTYNGLILSIEWLVRVKLFLDRGRALQFDEPFTLGSQLSAVELSEMSNAGAVVEGDEE